MKRIEQYEKTLGLYKPNRIYIDMYSNNSLSDINQTATHEEAHQLLTNTTTCGNLWILISNIINDEEITLSQENKNYLQNTNKFLIIEMRWVQELYATLIQFYSFKIIKRKNGVSFDDILCEFKKKNIEYWTMYKLNLIEPFLDDTDFFDFRILELIQYAMNIDYSSNGIFDSKYAKKLKHNRQLFSPKTRFKTIVKYLQKNKENIANISNESILEKLSISYSTNDENFIKLLTENILLPLNSNINIDTFMRSDANSNSLESFFDNNFPVPMLLNHNTPCFTYSDSVSLAAINIIYIEKYENGNFEGLLYDTINGYNYYFSITDICELLDNISTVLTNRHYYALLKNFFNSSKNVFIMLGQLDRSGFTYINKNSTKKNYSYYCFRNNIFGILFCSGEQNNTIFLQPILHRDFPKIRDKLIGFNNVCEHNDGVLETENRSYWVFDDIMCMITGNTTFLKPLNSEQNPLGRPTLCKIAHN